MGEKEEGKNPGLNLVEYAHILKVRFIPLRCRNLFLNTSTLNF